jgi:hypothetical protein
VADKQRMAVKCLRSRAKMRRRAGKDGTGPGEVAPMIGSTVDSKIERTSKKATLCKASPVRSIRSTAK